MPELPAATSLRRFAQLAWRGWLAASFVGMSVVAGMLAWQGRAGMELLIQTGPGSLRGQTLICVALMWLSAGAALFMLRRTGGRLVDLAAIVCWLLVLLLYLNVLRERIWYGDIEDYIGGAQDLHDGLPFRGRYVYPPLLATITQPLLALGRSGAASAYWLLNLVSLAAFYWLLKAVLERYGFARWLAVAAVTVFMTVNAPILRTLGYVQINLHVIDLILLAILCFPSHRILSAVLLAAAVHLKVSPIVLALPFLLTRDRSWIVAFAVAMVGLSAITFVPYGWSPFASFLHNAQNIHAANGVSFRDSSFDSLERSIAMLAGREVLPAIIWALKVPALVLLVWVAVRCHRRATFVVADRADAVVLNTLPAGLLLMLLASPILWVHHGVFVALPFLLIVRKLETPAAWSVFCFAYACTFLAPAFDVFPLSFVRLVSPLLIAVLMLRLDADAAWFARVRGASIAALRAD